MCMHLYMTFVALLIKKLGSSSLLSKGYTMYSKTRGDLSPNGKYPQKCENKVLAGYAQVDDEYRGSQ